MLDYTDVEPQKIIPDTIDANHSEGGNLAAKLAEYGYIPNINLFVFNYPNQDIVKDNAIRFRGYIENLISYAQNIGSVGMKQAFAINGEDYSFNIVGHSMGGLVARYYIENLGFDEHVEKLITIDTPHWGTPLANLSWLGPCDDDLADDSAMFGGEYSVNDNQLTDELNYLANRETKYYAIASINYLATEIYDNNYTMNIPTTLSGYDALKDYMYAESGNRLHEYYYDINGTEKIFKMSPGSEGDMLVPFLSQIGWSSNGGSTPQKRISFEKIFVLLDTNGGNVFGVSGLLHTKIQHRNVVMSKVINYLD